MSSILPPTARNDIAPDRITQEQLRNYFALRPKVTLPAWSQIVFVGAGVMLVCSICSFAISSSSSSAGGLGGVGFLLLLIAVGVVALTIYSAYGPIRNYNVRDTITDAAFDKWLLSQEKTSLEQACKRLGIEFARLQVRPPDPNAQIVRDPISIVGFERARYFIPQGNTANKFVVSEYRTGADGITRWRRNVYIWFFPKDRKLATYKRTVDAADPNEFTDKTQEYFYQAVSGLSTEQDRLERLDNTKLGGLVTISATSFTLAIENGDKITTPVAPVEAHLKMHDSGLEQAVKSLRDLLDATKHAQLSSQYGAYPTPGMPPAGYPTPGMPPAGYPGSYPPPAYPPAGYPPAAYPPAAGYPPSGYPPVGYPPAAYPPSGYPATESSMTAPTIPPSVSNPPDSVPTASDPAMPYPVNGPLPGDGATPFGTAPSTSPADLPPSEPPQPPAPEQS